MHHPSGNSLARLDPVATAGNPRVQNPRLTAAYRVCLFFFVFPLFAPALGGTVVYPFVLYGGYLLWRRRMDLSEFRVLAAGALLIAVYALVDAATAFRMLAFIFGGMFLLHTLADERRRALMLRMAAWHVVVVLLQFLLVIAGVGLDFSELFRSVYGPLLPPTGIHIDYNAFSQWDVFLPRVAGLNREPAYGCVLFLGFMTLALQAHRWRLATLLAAAVVCTLSKIVFPLLLALGVAWILGKRAQGPGVFAFVGKLLAFSAINLLLILFVKANIELVESAMQLDASYFHRFAGLYTLAERFDSLLALGNSQSSVGAAAIFADYEFLNDRRAFLDGSVLSKLAVDLGYVAAALYALVLAWCANNWAAGIALAIAGVFINFLSVAPATILLFVVLAGMARPRPGPPAPHNHAPVTVASPGR